MNVILSVVSKVLDVAVQRQLRLVSEPGTLRFTFFYA